MCLNPKHPRSDRGLRRGKRGHDGHGNRERSNLLPWLRQAGGGQRHRGHSRIRGEHAEGTTPDSRALALRRRQVVRALLADAPPGALLVVALGWVLGSLAGGFVSTWISQRSPVVHALILGGLLTLAGIANNLMLPPPVWFWVLTVIVFLPATYLGARLALRRGTTVAVPQNNGLQLPAGASPACDQGRHCRAPAPA